jgi:hypothetical protein
MKVLCLDIEFKKSQSPFNSQFSIKRSALSPFYVLEAELLALNSTLKRILNDSFSLSSP